LECCCFGRNKKTQVGSMWPELAEESD
jgi:hypothetical protein